VFDEQFSEDPTIIDFEKKETTLVVTCTFHYDVSSHLSLT